MKPIVAEFEKVPFEQYMKDFRNLIYSDLTDSTIKQMYDNIKIPMRETADSAGHDFYAPFGFKLEKDECIVIPTGIRANILNPDWFLMLAPRSGLGFKYRVSMANTVGIVDSDYYGSKNYGHIMAEIIYDGFDYKWDPRYVSNTKNDDSMIFSLREHIQIINPQLSFSASESIFQGIFIPYGTAKSSADVSTKRVGGFGSTSNK